MGKTSLVKHIFISTLTSVVGLSGSLASTPAHAEFVAEDTTTWWTISEIVDYEVEFEAKLTEVCGDDELCKSDIRNAERYSIEPTKYSILMGLKSQRFIITNINPTAESVKILFFDVNPRTGNEDPMKSLYIAWFDEWAGQIYEYEHSSFTDGSRPDTHMMYDFLSVTDEYKRPESNREFEISVAGSNLGNNETGKVGYHITTDRGFFAYGPADYSTCTNGIECQLYVSQNGEQRYFSVDVLSGGAHTDPAGSDSPDPDSPDPAVNEPVPSTNPSVEPDPSGTSHSDTTPIEGTDTGTGSTTASTNQPASGNGGNDTATSDATAGIISATLNRSTVDPLSPDTGKGDVSQDTTGLDMSESSNQEAHEFPWWIVLVMLSSAIAVIGCLTLPIGKKSKTSSKHAA